MVVTKTTAAEIFGVKEKQISAFCREDPFNDNSLVEGFICRKRNKNGGSLIITKVDGKPTEQVIWATPKLAYPYKDVGSRDWINFGSFKKAVITEKWNGMNILFYKYYDSKGNERITAKSKGTPFVGDSDVGSFLTLLKEALDQWYNDPAGTNFDPDYTTFLNWKYGEFEGAHAISFELCGQKEPHLVNYGFSIKLKPLFLIYENGKVKPVEDSNSITLHSYDDIEGHCVELQKKDLKRNETYRKENGLKHKYEYNHFITEGRVLYILDKEGFVVNRTMYKIKPTDIEEVHWQRFDETMEGRVDEALQKIHEREYDLTETDLREELDMGPKEWGKFGKSVKKYLKTKGVELS